MQRWHKLIAWAMASGNFLACGCGTTPIHAAAPPSPIVLAAAAAGPEPAPAPRPAAPAALGVPQRVAFATQDQAGARIRATVNGEAILEDEVRIAALKMGGNEATRRQQALQMLIEREVVLQDALARLGRSPGAMKILDKLNELATKEFDRGYLRTLRERANLKTDDELKMMLKAQGMTLEALKRQFEREFVATEYLRQRVMPALDRIGHVQVRDYYDKHPEDFKVEDAVEWREIFVSANSQKYPNRDEARKAAVEVAKRLQSGEDFTPLSKKYDDGFSVLNSGKGVGTRRGEIKPVAVEPVLFQLKPNQVGPVVEVPQGFHVVQVVKREHAGQQPLDDATQKQIREKLRAETAEVERKRLIQELKRQAVIDVAKDGP